MSGTARTAAERTAALLFPARRALRARMPAGKARKLPRLGLGLGLGPADAGRHHAA
jgi:hypothetical protein